MPTVAALPKTWNEPRGVALTFVVASPDGCDLNCEGCFVAQRGEAKTDVKFTMEDYRRFILGVALREPVSLVSVQGYEPLLDGAWNSAKAILQTGRQVGSNVSIVTNGTRLADRAAELAGLGLSALIVSVDSADDRAHDRFRGRPGAFQRTVEGLRTASSHDSLLRALMVSSVLRPKRSEDLKGMPELLRNLGLQTWIVTAMLRVGKTEVGAPIADKGDIAQELITLDSIARDQGVTMLVDDEFDMVFRGGANSVLDPMRQRVRRLVKPDGVVRLGPDGSISAGVDILRRVTANSVHWNTHEDPHAAVLRARQRRSCTSPTQIVELS